MNEIQSILNNPALTSAIVGAVVAGLTELAKRIDAIPLTEGQTGKIRATVAILALVGTILARIGSHNLSADNFVGDLVQTILTYLLAHTTYKAVIVDPNSPTS